MQIDELDRPEALPEQMGAFDRGLARIENAIAGVAALFILGLMLLGVTQIAVRALWNLPIRGYIDFVELMMAVIAFAAVGFAERNRAHIRMDFLPHALHGRTQIVLEGALAAIALFAVSILVYATWFSFQRTWLLGDSTMDINAPLWPSRFLLFFALAMLWVRVALTLAGYVVSFAKYGRRV